MYSPFLHNRIVLSQFETIGSIFPIFLGDIAGSTWHSRFFMFSAFQNNQDAVTFTFLCHDAGDWLV